MSAGLSDFEKIQRRFELNIKRVRNLIELFAHVKDLEIGDPSYRKDLLRAAVVMLHATLEDLIRQSLIWKLPETAPSNWKDLDCGNQKIALRDLLGADMIKLVRDSVRKHLNKTSYNKTEELVAAVEQIGVLVRPLQPFLAQISAAMERRHQIVHQSDRTEAELTKSHGTPRNIDDGQVEDWTKAGESLGNEVLEQLTPRKQDRVRVPVKTKSVK